MRQSSYTAHQVRERVLEHFERFPAVWKEECVIALMTRGAAVEDALLSSAVFDLLGQERTRTLPTVGTCYRLRESEPYAEVTYRLGDTLIRFIAFIDDDDGALYVRTDEGTSAAQCAARLSYEAYLKRVAA